MLAGNATDFLPYTLKLFAQAIGLNGLPIPPIYEQIFEILLSPNFCKRNPKKCSFPLASTPDLLQKVPKEPKECPWHI